MYVEWFYHQDQDKSSDIDQQPPSHVNKAICSLKMGGGLQNQHHIILKKYEAVYPAAVSENSSSEMIIIQIITEQCVQTYKCI